MSEQPLRVDADDVEFDSVSYQYLYRDRPLTGEMYEYGTDSTVRGVKAISGFVDGLQHGLSRVFYADGKLFCEARYEYGRLVGVQRKWHHNGQVQEENTHNDEGTWISTRRWSEDGELVYRDDA